MILTDEFLADLEAKADAATSGPWTHDDGNIFSKPLSSARHAAIADAIKNSTAFEQDDWEDGFIAKCDQDLANFEADSEFIAAANPTTIKALVAEVRRLKTAEHSSAMILDEIASWLSEMSDVVEELRKECK